MSNEVKRFSPEYCEAGGVGWAEMQEDAEGAWRKASDYDALAAELAAIRVAGGGQVEPMQIPDPSDCYGFGYVDGTCIQSLRGARWHLEEILDQLPSEPLMTVAQHQRIVAAMAAELEKFKQANRELSESNVRRRDSELKMRAELEAARKQEPVAYVLFRDGEVCYESDDSIVISNTPGDETDLYKWLPVFTIPPLAGKVSVPEWVPVSERLPEVGENVLVQFDTWGGTGMPQHTTATLHAIPRHAFDNPPIDMRRFVTVSSGHELKNVTHWMPIADLRALLATPSMEVKS